MGFALGQGPEDIYAGAEAWVEPSVTGGAATGSILDSIISTGVDLAKSITSPDIVKAAMSKYVFGQSTLPILKPGDPGYVAPRPSMIPGIPDSFLLIGGAAILFLVMSKKRR